MNALTFKIETFEGPLDLLLHLISKHKLNIYDIPIAQLLDQYLAYMDEVKQADMELASEFVEMAARLVHIKSVMLLPRQEEAEDLRRELTGELIEYDLCKRAAERLAQQYLGSVLFIRQPAPVEIDPTYCRRHMPGEMYSAYAAAMLRAERKLPPGRETFTPLVERKMVSVSSRVIRILRALRATGRSAYGRLFSTAKDKPEVVATFLALLELVKAGRVEVKGRQGEVSLVKKGEK